MKKLVLASFVLFCLAWAAPTVAPNASDRNDLPPLGIWQAEEDWNWEHEENFARWLTEVAPDRDFFLRHNIAIDCADTVYGFRWVYSRIHYLRNMSHTIYGVITNETLRPEWEDLPTAEVWYEDARFLAALDYILSKTFTGTLADDSYPVALTAEALMPGTFFLNLEGNKHVDLIYKSDAQDPDALPFEFVTSSVPRELKKTKFLSFWFESHPIDEKNGFRRFLWPRKSQEGEWYYLDPASMPFYSLEQFDPSLHDIPFSDYVYDKVKPRQNRESFAQAAVAGLVAYLRERVDVVNETIEYCQGRRSCRKKRSKDYDTYSTPSRDKRIEKHFAATVRSLEALEQPDLVNTTFSSEVIFELDGEPVTLLHIYESWQKKRYSSEPADDIYRRWGLKKPKKKKGR